MYARVVHFSGSAADLESSIAAYREQVLPYAREATGFRGHAILVDREGGRALSITLWAGEDALAAYGETAERFRTLLAETWGTPITGVEEYEVGLLELGG